MNYSDRKELARRMDRRRKKQRSEFFWNFLTICTVLATLALVVVFLMVYSDPYIQLNPFPPPTMPAIVVVPTSTSTPFTLPPTWTPSLKSTLTPTPPPATATPQPSPTQTDSDSTQSSTDAAQYTFVVEGAPSPVGSITFKPETGCTWQGVAGQVLNLQRQHLINIGIVLKGTYNGKSVEYPTISGTHTEYGESGYEFQLGTTPISSTGLLSIQLVDGAGSPLSEKVIFDTYGTCDKNLVMINFRQVR